MENEEDVIKLANNLKLILEINYWQLQLECSSNSSLQDLQSSTLCTILAILPQLPIKIIEQDIMEPLSRIVRNTKPGNQLLMMMVRSEWPASAWEGSRIMNQFLIRGRLNLFASVQLLLRAGADPDMVDDNGDSPLHILIRSFNGDPLDSTARLLVDSGVRLDKVNKQMQTVADIWFKRHKIKEWDHQGACGRICLLPDWCRIEVSKLQCLSARAIRRNRVPVNKLPIPLQTFVEIHLS